jgi:hypothetical protein
MVIDAAGLSYRGIYLLNISKNEEKIIVLLNDAVKIALHRENFSATICSNFRIFMKME